MVRAALLLLGLLAAAAPGALGRGQTAVTPIAKVLELLQGLSEKGRSEKEAEAVKFSAFSQWCDGQVRVKTNEIETASERIAQLSASIEKGAVTIRQLTARIEELEEDVGRWKKDQQSTREVRSKENEDYRATSQDYQESIDAIAGALAVLKKQTYDRPQAEAALLQVKSLRLVPDGAKAALDAYIQESQPERLLRQGAQAHGYEFQSGGIIELLAQLKQEFGTKRYELDAEELTAQHAFEQVYQQLTDLIEGATHEIGKKTALRAETEQAKAADEGSLAQTTADRAEDQKYLDETQALCSVKRSDFASRQKLREEELEALKKATELIGSQSVKGAGEKHLPSLLQSRSRTALVQLRSGAQRAPAAQLQIVQFLSDRAQSFHSRELTLLSEQIAGNPFDKVKKLIQNLIFKLTEEATAETEHKGWCDAELATNKNTRSAKTEAVNELTAEIEGLTADITQLTLDIKTLTAEVAELDAARSQATDERSKSKAVHEQTVADAKDAQVAVQQAIAVLKDFYAKSAQATALAQEGQDPASDAPETFEGAYKGLLPEGGSVVDFLEVILTDFSRLELDTAASEAAEVSEFKKFMFESEKDKALKENEKGHKSQAKTDKEAALHADQMELKATQEQLDAASAYFEKLKPTCVDSGANYEERVKQREAEMQSLSEALNILKGTDIA